MQLSYSGQGSSSNWKGSPKAISFDEDGIKEKLRNTHLPCYIIKDFRDRIGVSNEGEIIQEGKGLQLLAMVAPLTANQLGDATSVSYTHLTLPTICSV